MKRLLLIVLPLLLIFGCFEPINEETLIDKDGLKYHPDTKELYSGKVFKIHMGGKLHLEGSYKNGKKNGLSTEWYENGNIEVQRTFKNGELDGLNTQWYENGQKKVQGIFKAGKQIRSPKKWNEDGSVCND